MLADALDEEPELADDSEDSETILDEEAGVTSAEFNSSEQDAELNAEPIPEDEGSTTEPEDLNAEADRQAEALAAEAAAFDPPAGAQDIGPVGEDTPLIDAAVDNPVEEVALAA